MFFDGRRDQWSLLISWPQGRVTHYGEGEGSGQVVNPQWAHALFLEACLIENISINWCWLWPSQGLAANFPLPLTNWLFFTVATDPSIEYLNGFYCNHAKTMERIKSDKLQKPFFIRCQQVWNVLFWQHRWDRKKKKDHALKRCNCRKAWLAVVHALNNWFDRYSKDCERCCTDSIQLSKRLPFLLDRREHRNLNQTKRGQIGPGRKCATVNWKQADPSLELNVIGGTNYPRERRHGWQRVGGRA